MPKANRYFEAGLHYHLTHRCHDGAFLFRFACDRDAYMDMLRERSKKYKVPVLGYCITSNHVHLLVEAPSQDGIGHFMDALEGDFAQRYNNRKKRRGAFWNGRYHATAIESTHHLWQCLLYIDLNMVRAGVVAHPESWRWCACPELTGQRKRYRVVNFATFERVFGRHPKEDGFSDHYADLIADKLQGEDLVRDPIWSESLAVGRTSFIESLKSKIKRRMNLEIVYPETVSAPCSIRERGVNYA